VRLRVSPRAVRAFAIPAIRVLAATWRIRTEHEERWRSLYQAGRPHVFLLWQHRRQGIAIVVSEAREGQYLADLGTVLGYRTVRGSSTRGASRALLGAVRELREGRAVAFTPDGPRGPRRELKPGVVAAAQRGGGVIVPIHAEASRAWRLHSWDRFMIPQPAARVTIRYGRPFEVAAGEAGLADGLLEAGRRLDEIAGVVR
jgi:lysophospholipid acyltransferase (LPLAT)-like uncharacterized protein